MEALISSREVAEILGVKPQTMDYWAANGKGPAFYKLDGRRKYAPSDVRAWLEARKVTHL